MTDDFVVFITEAMYLVSTIVVGAILAAVCVDRMEDYMDDD